MRHPWRTKLTSNERARQERDRKQWMLQQQLEDERWRPNCTCPWHPDPLDPYYQCADCERRQELRNREDDRERAASAIEAPSGVETGNTDSTEGESAVGEAETPND